MTTEQLPGRAVAALPVGKPRRVVVLDEEAVAALLDYFNGEDGVLGFDWEDGTEPTIYGPRRRKKGRFSWFLYGTPREVCVGTVEERPESPSANLNRQETPGTSGISTVSQGGPTLTPCQLHVRDPDWQVYVEGRLRGELSNWTLHVCKNCRAVIL